MRNCRPASFRKVYNHVSARREVPASARLTCHFRHDGLKLGQPLAAPRSDMKTYSVGWLRLAGDGDRAGSSLAAYTAKGNRSKSRCSGPGMGGTHRDCRAGVDVICRKEGVEGGSGRSESSREHKN
jgi:hypothetical protein